MGHQTCPTNCGMYLILCMDHQHVGIESRWLGAAHVVICHVVCIIRGPNIAFKILNKYCPKPPKKSILPRWGFRQYLINILSCNIWAIPPFENIDQILPPNYQQDGADTQVMPPSQISLCHIFYQKTQGAVQVFCEEKNESRTWNIS